MGERDDACRLELVGSGIELIEGGGRLVDPGLLEGFRVDPQPVGAMDVDRNGYIVAVVFHGVGDFLVQQCIPLFLLGHILEHVAVEQAGCSPILDVGALDLRDAWRIASHRSAFEHGHGSSAAAAGHGAVLPGETVFLDLGLEHIDGRFFTTRCPPVHHFDGALGIGSVRSQGEQGCQGDRGSETKVGSHFYTLLLLCRASRALALHGV